MSYPTGMDHLEVLREKVRGLREEIAQIKELNQQYRLHDANVTEAQVAHGQRHERLEAIQQELAQLSALGRKVLSVEEMKEKHRSRLHAVKQAS
jgi:DNA repair exonuclease SbcCD ATPase subunit